MYQNINKRVLFNNILLPKPIDTQKARTLKDSCL